MYFEFQENIGDALLKAEALKLQFVGEMSGLKHFDWCWKEIFGCVKFHAISKKRKSKWLKWFWNPLRESKIFDGMMWKGDGLSRKYKTSQRAACERVDWSNHNEDWCHFRSEANKMVLYIN